MTDGSKLVGVGTLKEQEGAALTVRYASSGFSGACEAAFSRLRLSTVALAVHLQDVDVVGEPVEQRAGEAFRAEDLRPLVEGEIGGDHDRAPLVTLAEYLEE